MNDWDLDELARAHRLCDWMFEQFSDSVAGTVVEVGAGIGTFSARILGQGVDRLALIEPDPRCADGLEQRFGADARVEIARQTLQDAAVLDRLQGEVDAVICQNVLEHIVDDGAAIRRMALALRPGGELVLVVPAHPRLYGALDRAYGHHRRYTRERLRDLFDDAELELNKLYAFNTLGLLGWITKYRSRRPRLSRRSLQAYELLLRGWRPIERRVAMPIGLSLIARGHRPAQPPEAP